MYTYTYIYIYIYTHICIYIYIYTFPIGGGGGDVPREQPGPAAEGRARPTLMGTVTMLDTVPYN